ncbi:MAG: sugar phosphate isomerase/epimerase [Lachnospiraceae bacterium]|nr:sugar phosphate isomerase/epimerase [Lachnospiraceae bacterium]
MTDIKAGGSGSLLQIQPVHTSRDKWGALAESEGLGFEVLELSAPPALNESGLFKTCTEWYKASGRARSLHGVFIDINPASGDSKFRNLSRERCKESCRAALEVGAENIVFHSSCFPFLRGPYLEGWAALSADFYDEIAEEFGLNIFIENSPDIDPDPIKTLFETIKDERIGVCLDLGHANYSHVGIAGWFEELGDKIGYLHLSDNNGTYDDHLTLGKGTIDWEEADRLWRGLGKNTPMTLEVGNIESVKASISFLKEHGYFGVS